ncbi:MAG: hypothetical protein FWD40_02445, partial [Treponema sp.]|nr:hypothetical protein [Treponema sp.]
MKKIQLFIYSVLFAVLCFTACDNFFDTSMAAPGYGKVLINIGVNNTSERTVYPGMLFAKYEVLFTKVDIYSDEIIDTLELIELETGDDFLFELELNDWQWQWQVRVLAYARAEDTTPAASGTSEPFNVTSGDIIVTADIQLDKIDNTGSGTFNYVVSYPEGAAVTLFTLEKLFEEEAEIINLLVLDRSIGIIANTLVLSGTVNDVPAGYYYLTIYLDKDDKGTGANEVIYIYDKLGSAYGTEDAPVVFNDENFTRYPLSGTVTIIGDALVGQTLTADTGDLTGSGTIFYQWNRIAIEGANSEDYFRNEIAIEGANSEDYLLQIDDLGHEITVTVTRSENLGSITSDPTDTVTATFELLEGIANKLAWLQDNAESDTIYILEVTENEVIDPQSLYYDYRDNITIILKGIGANRTVSPSYDDGYYNFLFAVGTGVTLELENITLLGESHYTVVSVDGTLEMNQGTKIINSSSYYLAVNVSENGIFTMNGGEISGNSCGVGVYENGTFNMQAGSISSNTGTGVAISDGTFNMHDGEISGNSCGVRVYENGTFNMQAGSISSNTGTGV